MTMGPDSMLYVVGITGSYPGGSQLFLNKFDRTGTLIWSRIWGGSKAEDSRIVVADLEGMIYAVGATASYGHGDYDIFVLKFSSNGNLVDSLFWGGTGKETAHDAAIFGDYLYVTGETWSYGQDAEAGNGKSDPVLVKVNSQTMEGPEWAVSVESIDFLANLKIYPNPTTSILWISFPDTKPWSIFIYDLTGRRLMDLHEIQGPLTHIDVSFLPQGLYFIKLSNPENRTQTQKLLVR